MTTRAPDNHGNQMRADKKLNFVQSTTKRDENPKRGRRSKLTTNRKLMATEERDGGATSSTFV